MEPANSKKLGDKKVPRASRVFMAGRSRESVERRATEKYSQHTVTKVKLDSKKRVPRGARIRGYTKYYRVYLKARER